MSKISLAVEALDKYSAPAKKMAQVSEKMGAQFEAGMVKLKKLNTEAGRVDKFSRLESKLGSTASALDIAQTRTAALGRALAKTEKPTKALERQFDRSRRTVSELKQAHSAQKTELKSLRSELRGAGYDTRNLSTANSKLSSEMDRVGRSMELMAKKSAKLEQIEKRFDNAAARASNFTFVGYGMESVGRKMTQAFKGPIDEAISFESAMADVRKVVDFQEPQGFKKLGKTIRQLAKTDIPLAASEIASIAAEGGKFGVLENDLPDFIRLAAEASVAWDETPAAVSETLAKLSNVYQIPLGEVRRLGDAVNHLTDNIAGNAVDVNEILVRVGGTSRDFGLAAEQTAALANSFIALGIKPERAATGIEALLSKMLTATDKGSDFQEALAEIGTTSEELQSSIGRDAQGTLLKFLETVDKLDKKTRVSVLGRLFGEDHSKKIGNLAGSLDVYRKALSEVSSEKEFLGAVNREFSIKSQTSENKLQLFNNRLDDLKMIVGERLLPVMINLADKLTPVIEGIGNFIEKFPDLSSWMITITAGIGGLTLVLAPVVTAIGIATFGMAHFSRATSKLATDMALNSAKIKAAGAMSGGGGFGGRWGKMGKLGKLGAIGTLGIGALSIGSTWMSDDTAGNKTANTVEQVGGMVGTLAGAKVGAMAGAFLGPVGAVLGGLVGGAVGGVSGAYGGSGIGDFFRDPPEKITQPNKASQIADNRQVNMTITQLPGEDPEALAKRTSEIVMEKFGETSMNGLFDGT